MLKKDIEFVSDLQTSPATRHVYSLLSVLNNLLSNAVEAIEDSGTVWLRVYEHQGEIFFLVSDTGSGITSGDEMFIFIPGYTTKYDEQGNASTGIGLPHARNVIEELGGTLEIRQGEMPEKTVFEVRIPIHRL
nr:ATP-binding protein [Aneurinibacillus migulanus]